MYIIYIYMFINIKLTYIIHNIYICIKLTYIYKNIKNIYIYISFIQYIHIYIYDIFTAKYVGAMVKSWIVQALWGMSIAP
jgi:hypothetical protein